VPTIKALLSVPPSRRACPPARMAAVQEIPSLKHERGNNRATTRREPASGDCGPPADAARILRGVADPAGLRDGRIGLAPLAAVLSFLRREEKAYQLVSARTGEYAAEWVFAGLSAFPRWVIMAAPPAIRARLVMRVARSVVRRTCRTSWANVRWRKGRGTVRLRGSIFCGVRDVVEEPLCEFYAVVIRRLMLLSSLAVEVETERCRGTGGEDCLMHVSVRPADAAGDEDVL
jgi:hypothetical protein